MVTRAQIDKLAAAVEKIAERLAPPEPPLEAWVVDGDRCYQIGKPDVVLTRAELDARPTGRTQFPDRITRTIVHPARVEYVIVDPSPAAH
jgi:hypothetical protein